MPARLRRLIREPTTFVPVLPVDLAVQVWDDDRMMRAASGTRSAAVVGGIAGTSGSSRWRFGQTRCWAHYAHVGRAGGMLVERFQVEAHSVSAVARWAVAIVVVCGMLGVATGIERVIWADRLTEAVVLVIASTMAAAVSITVLLFIAWRVELADSAPDRGPSEAIHQTHPVDGADVASTSI